MADLKKGWVQLNYIESTGQWTVKLKDNEITGTPDQNRQEAKNLIDLLEAYLKITKMNG